jgi:queuine tRNA-ribosyltransferase
MFNFTIEKKHHSARLGTLLTPNGFIRTPAFIFCATKATLKAITPLQAKAEGSQIILSNTYHLMLQPSADVVEKAGGLHKFMGWNGPMLTDSGGFQIFSLGYGSVASEIKGRRDGTRKKTLIKINEDGATFKSYINGKNYFLSPEESVNIQCKLGADLVVVLDECTPFHVDKSYTKNSMDMSHRWALRSLAQFTKINQGKQAIYGIVQGGVYSDLREQSVDFVNSNNFFGNAIGGSLGADKTQMADIVAFTTEKLRKDRPLHLLGIGGIADIFNGVKCGVDTFDCVHPTRLARHGGALVRPSKNNSKKEHINIRNQNYSEDFSPIEQDCDCYTCANFTKAYLHHLIKAKEMLSFTLLSIHNIRFMNRLMEAIRLGIEFGNLEEIEKQWAFN